MATVTHLLEPVPTQIGGDSRGCGPFGVQFVVPCGDGRVPPSPYPHGSVGTRKVAGRSGYSSSYLVATVAYLQALIHTVRWGLERSRAVRGTVRRTLWRRSRTSKPVSTRFGGDSKGRGPFGVQFVVPCGDGRVPPSPYPHGSVGTRKVAGRSGYSSSYLVATVAYLQARIHTVRWGLERSRAVRDTVRRIGWLIAWVRSSGLFLFVWCDDRIEAVE
ncbi:hypothetical protein QAD02_008340 [Eretmocerus hayati]|uniref:Uncharacterized protein n=1 Tax=Eretmocerus hayati TaxID=131215 RepID=A0ACC2N7J4_9HYME|nr:hypothetical protein QAD02_008340 [Eretmocerus hayati]